MSYFTNSQSISIRSVSKQYYHLSHSSSSHTLHLEYSSLFSTPLLSSSPSNSPINILLIPLSSTSPSSYKIDSDTFTIPEHNQNEPKPDNFKAHHRFARGHFGEVWRGKQSYIISL